MELPDARNELIKAFRRRVPAAARDATRKIERELPCYARYRRTLTWSVERAIDHFVDLLARPLLPSDDILEHFRRIGAGEAHEGRSLEPLQSALRIAAGAAVHRLTEETDQPTGTITPATVAQMTTAALSYLDRLATAAAEGHTATANSADGARRAKRRSLLDALITHRSPADIKTLAADCDWPLPRTVAAVALHETGATPTLGPETLYGLHLAEPCLIVPDPEGPGRPRTLSNGLGGRLAAVGPAVQLGDTAESLRLARQALALAREGAIAAPSPIRTVDHLPMIVLRENPEMTSIMIERKLQPLLRTRSITRRKLAETLLACIECGFNTLDVAARMHLHPQTIRYRVHQLEDLLAPDMYDPAQRLEFHLALRAWLALDTGSPHKRRPPTNRHAPLLTTNHPPPRRSSRAG